VASIGHPVVGDTTYGAPGEMRESSGVVSLERNFLHAAELEFSHPRTEERVALKSALPVELRKFLEGLEKD
jgi:23S rRNA pseudouridine1911/1915/1917 synthase